VTLMPLWLALEELLNQDLGTRPLHYNQVRHKSASGSAVYAFVVTIAFEKMYQIVTLLASLEGPPAQILEVLHAVLLVAQDL
jgi:hypothetical protein